MKISICDSNYNIIQPLDLRDKGVSKIILKSNVNKPHELNFEFNQNLAGLYDYLLKNEGVIIRLEDGDINLAFFKPENSVTKTSNGSVNISFVSVAYLLNSNLPQIPVNNTDYSILQDSFQNLIVQVDSTFSYKFLGSDIPDLILQRGVLTNYQILNEICDQSQYSWRDNGLVFKNNKWIPEILTGDFDLIDSYSQNDSRYKTQYTSSIENYIDKTSTNINIITEAKINVKAGTYSLCLPYGTSSSGINNNTVFLTTTNFTWVNQNYPLTIIDGNVYILNANYPAEKDKVLYQPVSLAVTAQNNVELTNLLTDEQVYKYIYNKALSEFRKKTLVNKYEFTINFASIFLAGNKIKIKYRETQKVFQNGKYIEKTLFNIDDTQTFNEVTFDLTSKFI